MSVRRCGPWQPHCIIVESKQSVLMFVLENLEEYYITAKDNMNRKTPL